MVLEDPHGFSFTLRGSLVGNRLQRYTGHPIYSYGWRWGAEFTTTLISRMHEQDTFGT